MTVIEEIEFDWRRFNHKECEVSVNLILLCKVIGEVEVTENSILAALRSMKQFVVKVKKSEVFGSILVVSCDFKVKKENFKSGIRCTSTKVQIWLQC